MDLVISNDNPEQPKLRLAELIEYAQQCLKEHGDIYVAVNDCGCCSDVWDVPEMGICTSINDGEKVKVLVLRLWRSNFNHLKLVKDED